MNQRYCRGSLPTNSQDRSVAGPPLHCGGIGFVETRPGECEAFLLRDGFRVVASKSEIQQNFERATEVEEGAVSAQSGANRQVIN
jgi:hypothetical protein